jgi:hypothetical protein
MRFEDEQLIPKLYELGDRGRWSGSLYSDEHAKIQQLMEKTKSGLSSLRTGQLLNQDLRREVIDLLDNEKTFKGVREHHQEREEVGMLPELDKKADAEWRARTIEPYLKEWNCCMKHATEIVGEWVSRNKMEQIVAHYHGPKIQLLDEVEWFRSIR